MSMYHSDGEPKILLPLQGAIVDQLEQHDRLMARQRRPIVKDCSGSYHHRHVRLHYVVAHACGHGVLLLFCAGAGRSNQGCTGTGECTSPAGDDTGARSTTVVCVVLMTAEGTSAGMTLGDEEINPSGELHAYPSAWQCVRAARALHGMERGDGEGTTVSMAGPSTEPPD
jgi:hypothetical protein